MPRETLPIDAELPGLIAALREHGAAVLLAPTGSGKTTRVPPALLDAGCGPVWVVVPRRIAARAAARRMAAERGTELGAEVGYEVRFERRSSRATRLLVMTDGILLRKLQDDPWLEGAGAILFDEFHERRLATDLGLALAQRVRRELRPELRLVVASATLDPAPVARFLGAADGRPAAVLASGGRSFPVEIQHRPLLGGEELPAAVRAVLETAVPAERGDTLVFLPGAGEIAACARALAGSRGAAGRELLELHGDLSAERQDLVFAPTPRPKLVLATNVAESSITLPGLRAVIDGGLARSLRHDPAVGLDRLELVRISRASADQRAGRAGRTGPGLCVRLWSPQDHRSRPEFEEPEVARIDLSGALLQLLEGGEVDPRSFPWFEAPPPAALDRALQLLERLGALRGGALTALGRELVRLPLPPRLGTLLLVGGAYGAGDEAALAAALLAERDPFRRRPRETTGHRRDAVDCDLAADLRLLQDFEARGDVDPERPLDRGGARAVLRAAEQYRRLLPQGRDARRDGRRDGRSERESEGLQRALLAAYPDRLARRRRPGEPRALMSGGLGVELARESRVTEAEYFVCVELLALDRGPGKEPLVARASAFEPAWLPAESIVEAVELRYDEGRDRVVSLVQRRVGDFVLDSREGPVADGERAAEVLAAAAAQDLARALPLAEREVLDFVARVGSLRLWCPELGLPALDPEFWSALLPELAAGCRSFADLRRRPLLDWARAALSPAARAALEREAPSHLTVPSGSQIRLQYEPGRPPVLAARIQELFGLRATPRVAGGRVPVLLHLLAPNGRPQQVTDDLESFWSGTYFEVRRELKRRYPKHDWPDDPLAAPARRRPGRRP
jgi:ATP-dependent helicase HrpB